MIKLDKFKRFVLLDLVVLELISENKLETLSDIYILAA